MFTGDETTRTGFLLEVPLRLRFEGQHELQGPSFSRAQLLDHVDRAHATPREQTHDPKLIGEDLIGDEIQ